MLFPSINVTEDFQSIFYHLIEDESININEGNVNLFCLKIHNKNFEYDSLIQYLSNSIVSYCLSQRDYEEMYNSKQLGMMNTKAKTLFRNYTSNKGELGEVILYSFLESHLKAPKILSKMKMKTSTNDYVKRSDGIHMLKVDDNNYELIFGESKMYADLGDGLRNAFQSINELKTREDNNINDEIDLICSNIPSEFAEENYELIKRIIKPSRNDGYDYDISFAVFVGFEIELDKYMALKNIDFKKMLKEDVKKLVIGKLKKIESYINKLELDKHNIYIYLVPFSKIDETRKAVLHKLTV